MNNVYFSNEGMTSTTANYYANIAKEYQNAATERLNSVKFFNTSVAVIGSNEKQLMSRGVDSLEFIQEDLQLLASLNAFCAWVREAIKEKEAQSYTVSQLTMEDWANQQGIQIPIAPICPKDPKLTSEKDVIDSWDINKRNKYLRLEAFAATLGKYIHVDGAYNKARKNAHQALNKPITAVGTGRDMVLYYTEESIDIAAVDGVFMTLQEQHRGYEKELNQMKAELKDTVSELVRKAWDQHQVALDHYQGELRAYGTAVSALRAQFNTWRTNELERISKYKITIPDSLKKVFNMLQAAGDTSK